ncbi:MAG: hypothetical protein CMO74_15655 [Verrucomicrobiales bacterium]|nr:hypothetical protein [Verrucomicrobiales bacterium]|tara:strand:- start:2240 stop:2890 length:651 start_codon:yes stop_codon:yes gene_type:complete
MKLFSRVILCAVLAAGSLCADQLPPGFVKLFNGKDLKGWKAKPGGWVVEKDGVFARKPGGGYVWTEESFGDFILDLEVKLAKRCNSGVFFRTNPKNAVQGGFEIQVLDSAGKAKVGKHDMGALYDAMAPKVNAAKPAGEWNKMRISCRGPMVNVILNGKEVVSANLDHWVKGNQNPDGSRNKFRTALKDLPRKGHIGLQDHGQNVWFRNIFIKRLD